MATALQCRAIHAKSFCKMKAEHAQYWPLELGIIFLNHGSFGSCPRPVLQFQQELRDRLERQPVQFFVRDLEGLLDESRAALAQFAGARAEDLVFVPNATSGVNTVLRSLQFQPGDELLVTNHEYNACRNALAYAANRAGAKVVVAPIPFPLPSDEPVLEAVLGRVTARTRLALLDHVTSPTAIILPIARLVKELAARGVDVLVDGAHAPGMVPLDLSGLGAAYYTGNCHKWLCGPKTAGFLHVRSDKQNEIHPLSISHGLTTPRQDRSRFLIEFAWTGTTDPTAGLSVGETLQFMGRLLPGGWPEIMARNRELALAAQKMLCQTLQIPPPAPPHMIGSMAAVPLPDTAPGKEAGPPLYSDVLQDYLLTRHRIEVPVIPWPAAPKRLLRVSAQLYNSITDYETLARVLPEAVARA